MKLGLYPNKHFKEDIKAFKDKLAKKEPFTFSKYADGEWMVMNDTPLNNREFEFKNHATYINAKRMLIESFQYKHPQYYIGISCPCCQGVNFKRMKVYSTQPNERLTWANLWVNSNYEYYLKEIIPEYKNYKTVLVANENSDLSDLPFTPDVFCPISNNAWINNIDKIDRLKNLIFNEKMKGWLFLFCCGPFGNILAHRLHSFNNENTYIDIGSTLNPFLKTEGFRRGYFSKYKQMKDCVWGE